MTTNESLPDRAAPAGIRLSAETQDGRIVARYSLDAATWYRVRVPLIDDAGERARGGVRRIVAELRDGGGRLEARWSLYYCEAGRLIDAVERRQAHPAADLRVQLLQRLRWLAESV